MHVAIDAAPLGSGQGGDETYLRGLLAALAESVDPGEGHRFTVHMRPGEPVPSDLVTHPDFTVRRLPAQSTARRLTQTLPAELRATGRRPDVLYSTVHAPLRSPVPVVLQVHDLSFLHHPDMFATKTRVRLHLLVRRQVRQAAVVCTISDFSRHDLIDTYGLQPDRVHVVPPVLPKRRRRAKTRSEELERWLTAVGVRSPYVLAVGNLHPRKNIARLIEAFAVARRRSLPDHQLVICGHRRWGEGVEERAAASTPAGSVRFLGRVDDDQRDHLLRGAAMLGYPSLFEGFGLPPLEAMAVGVPVLASDRAAIPEAVGDGALLVDPTDVEAMAAGIERLCTDGPARFDLACRGYERVRSFSAAHTTSAALRAFGVAAALRPCPVRGSRSAAALSSRA